MSDRLVHGAETLEMAMAEIAKGDTRKASELVSVQYPFVAPLKRRGIRAPLIGCAFSCVMA
jgi:hypothetical protein